MATASSRFCFYLICKLIRGPIKGLLNNLSARYCHGLHASNLPFQDAVPGQVGADQAPRASAAPCVTEDVMSSGLELGDLDQELHRVYAKQEDTTSPPGRLPPLRAANFTASSAAIFARKAQNVRPGRPGQDRTDGTTCAVLDSGNLKSVGSVFSAHLR